MATTQDSAGLPGEIRTRPSAARLAVAALFFFNGALFATWASRIPAVQTARGLSNGGLGLALLAIGLGAVVAMPMAGILISRVGSRRVCKITAALFVVFLVAVVLSPNHMLFIAALFCFGANHGALDVAMNAQAVAVERDYDRPIMSSFHALWSVGGLAGAALGGLLAAQGLNYVIHITSVTLLMGAAILFAFSHLLNVRQQEAHVPAADAPKFGLALPTRGLFALGLVAFCIMMGEGAIADWIAVYLRNNLGSAESLAAAGYATFSITMAAGRFLGDGFAKRWSPVAITRWGCAFAGAGLLLALIGHDAILALVGTACVGAGFSIIVPLVFSAAGRSTHVSPGIALASVTTLGYLGFLVGPPLIGFGAEGFGLRIALGIVVLTSLIASALAPSLASPSPKPSAVKQ